MFSSSANGAAPSGMEGLIGFAPWILIFVIFYFLMIRPQQRRAKLHRDMILAVKKNDTAVTGGGLIGKVTKVDESEIEMEISQGVRIRVIKAMLSDVRPFGAKPAND
jgi:preprotein translocase subunit YajC